MVDLPEHIIELIPHSGQHIVNLHLHPERGVIIDLYPRSKRCVNGDFDLRSKRRFIDLDPLPERGIIVDHIDEPERWLLFRSMISAIQSNLLAC